MLYTGCVKPLGMSDRRIKPSQIYASHTDGSASGNEGRLYNVPSGTAMNPTFWAPPASASNPFLQISFDMTMTVTAIATQGHYNEAIQEFASSYDVRYSNGGGYIYLKVRFLIYFSEYILV